MTLNKGFMLVILIGIAAVLLVVFYSLSTKVSVGQLPQVKGGQMVIELKQLNNSGETGTAILEEKEGYIVVTLNVVGGKDGTAQPAHIHSDTCPGLGKIKYPLKNVVNGISVTTLNSTIAQLKTELPLAINVHESTDNIKNYVTCGEVALP